MEHEICKGNFGVLGVEHKRSLITFSVENLYHRPCSLILYPKGGEKPQEIPMEADPQGSAIWSVGLRNLDPGAWDYNFKIGKAIVTDPYAKRMFGREQWGAGKKRELRSGFYFKKFYWGEDCLPRIAKEDMVIYKLHARGFSMGMPRADKDKGTLSAVERKVAYLKEMGVTTLLFMPLYEFEEIDVEAGNINYWGYANGNYLAPKAAYLNGEADPNQLKHFIKKLHHHKLEFIMEFYFTEAVLPNFILEVLKFWAKEYHVDGFRLLCGQEAADLAAKDIYLSGRKLFCEYIPEPLCEEGQHAMHLFTYNDWFSYGVRKMLNHQGVDMWEFIGNLRRQRKGMGFVNFVADNNGFTLYDLFSYSQKRNQANGNDNLDGNDWNFSSNCGQEGETKDKDILALRDQQIKNALACLYLAQGIPLIWMGDENGNSQWGNNNAYCQDNAIGWKSWQMKRQDRAVYDFVKGLDKIRKDYPVLHNPSPMQMSDYKRIGCPDLSYHGERAWQLNVEQDSLCVGIMYCGDYAEHGGPCDYVYVAYNFSDREAQLALPALPENGTWNKVMDTAKEGLEIFAEEELATEFHQTVTTKGRSVCVLAGRIPQSRKGPGKRSRKTSLGSIS